MEVARLSGEINDIQRDINASKSQGITPSTSEPCDPETPATGRADARSGIGNGNFHAYAYAYNTRDYESNGQIEIWAEPHNGPSYRPVNINETDPTRVDRELWYFPPREYGCYGYVTAEARWGPWVGEADYDDAMSSDDNCTND
jgi:hypothetical protein